MNFKLSYAVIAVLGLGLPSLFTGQPLVVEARAADPATAEAASKNTFAFLYGEAIADRDAGQGGGFTTKRIKWTLGSADGKKQWPLAGKPNGRESVSPIGRTIILKKDPTKVVLLGPQGKEIELSLKEGPLADGKPPNLELNSVPFSISPDGKTCAFISEAGDYYTIALDKLTLTYGDLTRLDWYAGIEFSADGKRIAYSRPESGKDVIYSADPDGKNEVKLAESEGMKGFGFVPDGRVGVVTTTKMTTYDAKTGKAGDTVTWDKPLTIRTFGGFSPDGSAMLFDDGGPYHLDLYHFDLKTQKLTAVKKKFLETFQRPVWVRVSAK